MAATAVKPWTGNGCVNAWTVIPANGSPFEQAGNANYGTGNTNGLTFKNGTTNLADSMITTTAGVDARGSSGTLTFYLATSISSSSAGWALQLNPGTGFTTRLAGQANATQSWQPYSCALQPGDLVSNLLLRFQFSEGAPANRIFLDQITLATVSATGNWTNTILFDDGLHGDRAAGDGVYGGMIPAFPTGTTLSYYLTASDPAGLTAFSPATPPATVYSYALGAGTNVSPALAGSRVGSQWQLGWDAQTGIVYTVQWSEDLIHWTNGPVVGSTNLWLDLEADSTMGKRFYRLVW